MLSWHQVRSGVDVAGEEELQFTMRELGDRCCADTVHVRFSEEQVSQKAVRHRLAIWASKQP